MDRRARVNRDARVASRHVLHHALDHGFPYRNARQVTDWYWHAVACTTATNTHPARGSVYVPLAHFVGFVHAEPISAECEPIAVRVGDA